MTTAVPAELAAPTCNDRKPARGVGPSHAAFAPTRETPLPRDEAPPLFVQSWGASEDRLAAELQEASGWQAGQTAAPGPEWWDHGQRPWAH